jgi:hypothetical protein
MFTKSKGFMMMIAAALLLVASSEADSQQPANKRIQPHVKNALNKAAPIVKNNPVAPGNQVKILPGVANNVIVRQLQGAGQIIQIQGGDQGDQQNGQQGEQGQIGQAGGQGNQQNGDNGGQVIVLPPNPNIQVVVPANQKVVVVPKVVQPAANKVLKK